MAIQVTTEIHHVFALTSDLFVKVFSSTTYLLVLGRGRPHYSFSIVSFVNEKFSSATWAARFSNKLLTEIDILFLVKKIRLVKYRSSPDLHSKAISVSPGEDGGATSSDCRKLG